MEPPTTAPAPCTRGGLNAAAPRWLNNQRAAARRAETLAHHHGAGTTAPDSATTPLAVRLRQVREDIEPG